MNNGPKISLKMTCDGCQFHVREYYSCEDENGDSGWDHYCTQKYYRKYIGCDYNTPVWCPLLPESLRFEKLTNGQYTQISNE